MKKAFSVLVIFVLFLFIFTGCTDNTPTSATAGFVPTTGNLKVNLKLPVSCEDRQYVVYVVSSLSNLSFGSMGGSVKAPPPSGGSYQFNGYVPAGNEFLAVNADINVGHYYIFAHVINNSMMPLGKVKVLGGYPPVPGDFIGVYGGSAYSIPKQPNVSVNNTTEVTIDMSVLQEKDCLTGRLYGLPDETSYYGTVYLVPEYACYPAGMAYVHSGMTDGSFAIYALPGNYNIAAEIMVDGVSSATYYGTTTEISPTGYYDIEDLVCNKQGTVTEKSKSVNIQMFKQIVIEH